MQNRAFALTGNSTSLVKSAVSVDQPARDRSSRASTKSARKPPEMTAIGFVRGEPFVEIVSRDLTSGDYNFYLFTFERQCDYAHGLRSGQLAHRRDRARLDGLQRLRRRRHREYLARLSVVSPAPGPRHQEDLAHAGAGEPLAALVPAALRAAHRLGSRAHGAVPRSPRRATRQYGGIPIATIQNALDEGSGAQLEALLARRGSERAAERLRPPHRGRGQGRPASPTWEAQFAVALAGDAIARALPASRRDRSRRCGLPRRSRTSTS